MSEAQLYIQITICLFVLGGIIPLLAAVLRKSDCGANESLVQATSSGRVVGTHKLGVLTSGSLWLALAGSGLITFYAFKMLITGGFVEDTLWVTQQSWVTLPAFSLTVYIDHLAAFFLLLIGGLSIGIAIYSFEYLRQEPDRLQIAGGYNLFVLSEILFVIANNVFFFVLLLEFATLTCGFLLLHEHYKHPDQSEHQQAIKTYMIANHIGGVFVLAALLVLALFSHQPNQPATFDMSIFRQMSKITDPTVSDIVFLLALIGFGIKAGIAPFHIWVAIAHPNLPTNAHAISVGIMIKVALYGMIRVFFQFLPPNPPWWWGFTVLLVAALTALIGVRNALYGNNLKDSLADHSVENIGIILAGIGLALIFAAGDLPQSSVIHSLVGLALVASLYHLLNHTVFKSLLYLCAGAINYLTGVVELKKLGGLIHRYRWTSACFLIGSVAIAGFPPFNGFISEWLTLQTLIAGMNLLINGQENFLLPAGIVLSTLLLVSAFALTALAFVKIAGEVLLGKPRDQSISDNSAQRDIPWQMRGVLIILAVLCLVLGLFPWQVMMALGTIVNDLGFPLVSARAFSSWGGISINAGSQYSAHLQPEFLFTLFGLMSFVWLLAVLTSRFKRSKAVWTCGTQYDPGIMQYTSSAFTSQMRDFVGKTLVSALLAPVAKRWDRLLEQQSARPGTPPIKTWFDVSAGRRVGESFRQVYYGLINLLRSIAQLTGSFFQNGDLRNYLLYIFLFFITVVFFILIGVK